MPTSYSDEYFHSLSPQTERYDVTVAEELAFCVFPNGLKAWVHLYPFENYQRRRTLGLFPEMRYADALAALPQARRIVEAETQNVRTRSRRRSMQRWLYPLLVGIGGALATWLSMHLLFQAPAPDAAQEAASQTISPASSQPRSGEGTAPSAGDARESAAANGQASSSPTQPETSATPAAPPAGNDDNSTAESAEPSVPSAAPEPAPDTPTPAASPADPAVSAGEADEPGPSAAETAAAATPPAAAEPQRQHDEHIIRAQLTHNVIEREPVDRITSPVALGPDQDDFTLYYFTEVHALAGQTVVHRWFHNGELRAEVPFEIGADWRWRVYSSKSIPPARTGTWTVKAVIAATEQIIAQHQFTVTRLPAN